MPAANEGAAVVPSGVETRLNAPLPMKAGARYMGSVVVTTNVESWAASETVRNKNDVASEKVGAERAARLQVWIAGPRAIGAEVVALRHTQRQSEAGDGEETGNSEAVREGTARVGCMTAV